MSISVSRHRNQIPSYHPRVKTPDSSSRPSPRPNTPSRTQNRSFEPQPRGTMDSPTPTPRKRVRSKRGTRKPDQRENAVPDGTADLEPSSEDELMNLLGVGPAPKDDPQAGPIAPQADALPQKGGLLAVTKEDIAASTKGRRGAKADKADGLERQTSDAKKRNMPRKRNAKKETVVEKGFAAPTREDLQDSAVGASIDTPSTKPAVLSEKTKRPLHDRRNREESGTMSDSSLVPFDMSALSQSLPNRNAGLLDKQLKNGKASGKSNTPEWDMPVVSGTQELTWQQKLQQTSTPNSGKGSRPSSDRKTKRPPSAFNQSSTPGNNSSRPAHQRRASADSVPIPAAPQSAPPYRSSGFDDDIPYHIGFNVHRAPQTPNKGAINPIPANSPLPIIPGEFPRINKVNKAFDNVIGPRSASGSSLKYAGPTAHSSPHAASLAKPDLDDF